MRILLLVAGLILAACQPPPVQRIDGPYAFSSALGAGGGGRTICYRKGDFACDIRVPAAVALYASNEEYVSAAVQPPTDPSRLDYYFVVRLFDNAEADGARCLPVARAAEADRKTLRNCAKLAKITASRTRASNCAVRGPFTQKEFNALRRCHCVPDGYGSGGVKCIPAPTIAAP